MNFICGWYVANNILRKSFKDKVYITPLKLNCLVYLVYSYYLYRTGNKLLNEHFIKTSCGPCLPSVYGKFNGFGNKTISRFATDAKNRVIVVNGEEFDKCLLYVWDFYKDMDDEDILNYVNGTNAVCKKEVNELLDDVDILEDEINKNSMILENAKVRKKSYKYDN